MKQRLDKYTQEKNPNLSRPFIKKQIRLGYVLVNDKKVKPSYVLCENDNVTLSPSFSQPAETKIQPNPEIKLNIIYEDTNVIVIDKPAGLIVHPRQTKTGAPIAKESNNTLASGLLAYYPPLASVGDQPDIRPGIVHRLDKDTSGVMIIAKNQPSFEWLKRQFKERKTQKKYLALLNGCPKETSGIIRTFITRSATEPSKQKIIPVAQKTLDDKREAVTKYKAKEKFKDYCLIEAYPKTGRLHQIRAQFAWLGCPVAGDTKYGLKNRPTPDGLKRQFLHAAELEITLPDSSANEPTPPVDWPNGQKKTFKSPLPSDLRNVLLRLEKTEQ